MPPIGDFKTPQTNELPTFPVTRNEDSFDWVKWVKDYREKLNTPIPEKNTTVFDKGEFYYGFFAEDDDFEEISLKHEEYRTYIYGNGVELTIHEPTWLIIDKEDPTKHIVEDATAVYEVTPGWIAIKKGY